MPSRPYNLPRIQSHRRLQRFRTFCNKNILVAIAHCNIFMLRFYYSFYYSPHNIPTISTHRRLQRFRTPVIKILWWLLGTYRWLHVAVGLIFCYFRGKELWFAQMPVSISKRRGKYRLVEPSGRIARGQSSDRPIDGGGHQSWEKALAQLRAVNASLSRKQKGKGR